MKIPPPSGVTRTPGTPPNEVKATVLADLKTAKGQAHSMNTSGALKTMQTIQGILNGHPTLKTAIGNQVDTAIMNLNTDDPGDAETAINGAIQTLEGH